MKTKIYSSKEEFERKNPYVIVLFETINDQTFSSVVKSFTNKKSAVFYCNKHSLPRNCEIMTRNKYDKEASQCM